MTKTVELSADGKLSRPLRLLARDGFLRSDLTLFDYGCGDGNHVACLTSAGIRACGWDPKFNPEAPRVPADIVNLGYVLNVLSSAEEQSQVLQDTWRLTRRLLVVSVPVRPHNLRIGSSHHWLAQFVERTLRAKCESAGAGIVYVFKDAALRQEANRRLGGTSPWRFQHGIVARRSILKGAGAVGLATCGFSPLLAMAERTQGDRPVCMESRAVLLEKIRKIIAEHLGVPMDRIVEQASFTRDLGGDSLDAVELVMAFEEEFVVEIPDDDAGRIVTVRDAADVVFELLRKQCEARPGTAR